MMVLFSGQDLDGWITIAGKWALHDEAMVCKAAPASIRSSFESDRFTLSFKYRSAGGGSNRVFVHSKMTTGGVGLALTPIGAVSSASSQAAGARAASDDWLTVEIMVGPDRLRAKTSHPDGRVISEAKQDITNQNRGFIRFEATEPGLQIRDVVVREAGFRPMFDRRTLEGWEIVRPKDPDDPGWVIEDGVVRCRGRRSSWLRTLRTYDNFVLRLEYQLPPRGNSGIFLRAPIEGRVSRIGLEIQLLDDPPDRGYVKSAHHTGAVYDGIAPEVRVPAPANQWNAVEVFLDGKHIRTTLNAVRLYDADLDDAEKDINSHRRPLATRRAVGFIGLQDHSTTVRFRNVRIRELPSRPKRPAGNATY